MREEASTPSPTWPRGQCRVDGVNKGHRAERCRCSRRWRGAPIDFHTGALVTRACPCDKEKLMLPMLTCAPPSGNKRDGRAL